MLLPICRNAGLKSKAVVRGVGSAHILCDSTDAVKAFCLDPTAAFKTDIRISLISFLYKKYLFYVLKISVFCALILSEVRKWTALL